MKKLKKQKACSTIDSTSGRALHTADGPKIDEEEKVPPVSPTPSRAYPMELTDSWFDQSVIKSIFDGWLAPEGKRFAAVRHVVIDKIGWDTWEGLPPATFYAPNWMYAGAIYQRKPTGVLIYLSPTLEFDSKARVNFVVAHEIAHFVLRHWEPGNEQVAQRADRHEDRPCEIAADQLVASWGIKRVKRSGYERMLTMAIRERIL